MGLIYYAIPLFLATIGIEYALHKKHTRLAGYETKDAFASLAMGSGFLGVELLLKLIPVSLYILVYPFRLFEIEASWWWAWLLLFVMEDFCYYLFHRSHHHVRFLWAAHINHHSSKHYNLTTALRQSWTTPITGAVFWLPLAIVGFPLEMVLIQKSISLLYQYWLHTELIGNLGWFETIFNTPSHHRVHHGRNPIYLDRNHAGILIIWDKLFGTFEPEGEPVDYGLTKNIDTFNPVKIAFHEWSSMIKDSAAAPTLRGKIGYWLQPPGWRDDGTGKTARELRAEYVAAAGTGQTQA